MDKKELINNVRQNVILKDEIDNLTKRQTEIKSRITETVIAMGEEDDRGHVVVEIDDEVSGIAKVMRQKRVTKSLDQQIAEDLLEKKGLKERCLQPVYVLNEEQIMAAYYEGLLTEEDIDTMFPAKITWALVMAKN